MNRESVALLPFSPTPAFSFSKTQVWEWGTPYLRPGEILVFEPAEPQGARGSPGGADVSAKLGVCVCAPALSYQAATVVPLALPLQRISREGGRRLPARDRPAAAAGTATHRYNLARFVVRSKPRGPSIATQTEPDLGVWATEALGPAKGVGTGAR